MKRIEVKRHLFIVTTIISFTAFTVALSFGQSEKAKDAFAAIPESIRAGLVERLNLLVEYERTRQWGKLSDLLYQAERLSKQHFVRERYKRKLGKGEGLFDFIPKRSYFFEAEQRWIVEGCGKVRGGGRVMSATAIVRAVLEDGEWYLSRVTFTAPKGDPCANNGT
jgi:hypothetical protein